MKVSSIYFLSIFSFFSISLQAQQKSAIKFGNVSVKDFEQKIYTIDSNANAVVIADIGSSMIEGNTKSWFSLIYKHFKRVHILNKNGYDAANVSISLYTSENGEEELDRLKAVTYNLENGKVVETKLDVKTNVFKDKVNKNWVVKKFTFPNVKEGSIIEFEYTKNSDFLQNLEPWEFQGAYPRIWSEYNLSIPDFLGYVFLAQGYQQFDIKDKKSTSQYFTISDSRSAEASARTSFNANVTENRWVINNVPALKEESFTSTLNNHITKIEFQLSEYREPLVYQNVMGTWPKLSEDLMKSEYFGLQLTRDNGWLNDILNPLVKGISSKTLVAKKIYEYVRDNYTCTDYSDVYINQNLKNLVKSKNGSVAEINLLLTAMLRHEDILADPVLLSTRTHGFIYAVYPIMSKFNYVVVQANLDGEKLVLDASEPRLGFGYLPLRCYNGPAKIINGSVEEIDLSSDKITEQKSSITFIINNEKGESVGTKNQYPGYFESLTTRNTIKEKGKSQLEKDLLKSMGSDITISNLKIDSLDTFENSIGISYDFEFPKNKEDVLYINPLFGDLYKENPFKSAERFYPVEMPYLINEAYTLQMEIPVGYVVDELPRSMVVKLNEDDDGIFEYRISKSASNISFRYSLKINRTNFMPDEYKTLREFFNLVVAKQSEQIVFKKKVTP